MTTSFRHSVRLVSAALVTLAAASFLHAQSMMLRNTPATAGGSAINTGDFNNDGILDLVTVSNDGAVSVDLGRGDGTFAPPINTSTGLVGATDIALGDFNNDGKLDIAIIGFGGNAVQVLLGNGDGTFQPPENIVMNGQPVSLAAADFNHDGKLDLAVGMLTGINAPVSAIAILQGDGAGHFSLANTLQLCSGNASVVTKVRVGDFNRDGKADIAVLELQAVAVWFGNGNFRLDQGETN